MTQQEKLNLIVELSIPSILAQLSSIIMFFIDMAMVGHLGAQQAASIGLVESSTWVFFGLTGACSMGFSVQVAHAIGANDFKRARRILRQAFTCCLIFSSFLLLGAVCIHQQLPYWLGGSEEIAPDASLYFLIFSLAVPFYQLEGMAGSMLKCSGNMKIPSMLNILMCCMDVMFNYLFIYTLGLGVVGAAIGSLLAIFVTMLLMVYFLWFRSPILSLKGNKGSFRPTEETVRTAINIGIPMGFQQILMGGAQIVSTMIVAPLGTIAIAANSFAITAESICYMPGYGIADAATTLVGQGIGAGQRLLTRRYDIEGLGNLLVMTVTGILMYVFALELMGLMTPVEAICEVGAQSLRIEAFAEPMFAASIVCYGVFVGAGDTLKPAIMNLTSMWAVRLTLAAWLAPIYGLPGVWTAMAIELTFRGIIFLIRLFSGNWMNTIKT